MKMNVFLYPDIFFHIWYRDRKGPFIPFNNKHAHIDPVIDPTASDSAEVYALAPGKTALLKRNMNPFSIHGNKGPVTTGYKPFTATVPLVATILQSKNLHI